MALPVGDRQMGLLNALFDFVNLSGDMKGTVDTGSQPGEK